MDAFAGPERAALSEGKAKERALADAAGNYAASLLSAELVRRERSDGRISDETTILNFWHLLERHGLTEAIVAEVKVRIWQTSGSSCALAGWWMLRLLMRRLGPRARQVRGT